MREIAWTFNFSQRETSLSCTLLYIVGIRHQIVWLTPLPEDLASRLRKWSPKIKAEMKTAAFLPRQG